MIYYAKTVELYICVYNFNLKTGKKGYKGTLIINNFFYMVGLQVTLTILLTRQALMTLYMKGIKRD